VPGRSDRAKNPCAFKGPKGAVLSEHPLKKKAAQVTQELLLIRLAERLDVNTRDLMPMLTTLAGREERNSSGNGLHASPGDIE
jgi:hypothetical protein